MKVFPPAVFFMEAPSYQVDRAPRGGREAVTPVTTTGEAEHGGERQGEANMRVPAGVGDAVAPRADRYTARGDAVGPAETAGNEMRMKGRGEGPLPVVFSGGVFGALCKGMSEET